MLGTAARLGQIGRNVADAELRQSPPHLRLHALRHRLPGLRRMEIVTATVGIELAEQPVPIDHLGQRAKARRRALLRDDKARVDRAGRVVEGDQQIVLPLIARSQAKREASPAFARAASRAASCPHRPPRNSSKTLLARVIAGGLWVGKGGLERE
jgi:hypothetical protein